MTKVLVVEDDYFNRQLVFEILTAQGFMVNTATDGLEAIRMTENELYDFILMDINLPGIDGIKTTRIIRHMATMIITLIDMPCDFLDFLYIKTPLYSKIAYSYDK